MSNKCHDLHTRWAFRHLAIMRDTQRQFSGSLSAMELSMALNAAYAELVDENPAYKAALEIERELNEHGFEVRRIEP